MHLLFAALDPGILSTASHGKIKMRRRRWQPFRQQTSLPVMPETDRDTD